MAKNFQNIVKYYIVILCAKISRVNKALMEPCQINGGKIDQSFCSQRNTIKMSSLKKQNLILLEFF